MTALGSAGGIGANHHGLQRENGEALPLSPGDDLRSLPSPRLPWCVSVQTPGSIDHTRLRLLPTAEDMTAALRNPHSW